MVELKVAGWGMAGLLGTMLLAEPVQAGFAPIYPGANWVYQGTLHVRPMFRTIATITEKETITLTGVSRTAIGDTVFCQVLMKDSLSAREWIWHLSGRDSVVLPKDTVVQETRTYAIVGDKVAMLRKDKDSSIIAYPYPKGNPLATYSLFENTSFFLSDLTLPGSAGYIQGANRQTLELKGFTATAGDRLARWDGWFVVGNGIYWGSMRVDYGAACGPLIQPFHKLESRNGTRFQLGVEPPSTPLLKEARIACALVRLPGKVRVAFARGGMEIQSDIAGRILVPRE